MIISVDFDDTLCLHRFNIYTDAINICRQHGLMFNAVNENLPIVITRLGYNPRKIFADLYIDDKAIKP